jgi:hypothetical protein
MRVITGQYEQAAMHYDEVWHMQTQPVGVGLVFGVLNPATDPFKVCA